MTIFHSLQVLARESGEVSAHQEQSVGTSGTLLSAHQEQSIGTSGTAMIASVLICLHLRAKKNALTS
jgi:hypothetical protein